jgi:uncharacterized glyoxalase superfamily protein PhnB
LHWNRENRVWITIDVEDAIAEYQRIAAMGVPMAVELRDEPWGERHFVVADPNGVVIQLVQWMTLSMQ